MRILLIGFGSVGRAFASLLEERRDHLRRAYSFEPRLVAVLDNHGAVAAPPDSDLPAAALLAAKQRTGSVGSLPRGLSGSSRPDPDHFIRHTPADLVVEASPSVVSNPGPAFTHMRAAFASRKHVVSVNKAPPALAMRELVALARAANLEFRYSGAVGAGIPVLATARTLARGDRITRIRAVLNGTTNFILWRMNSTGESFHAALAEAIARGYAETDPSADIDGLDTAVKLVILANTVLAVAAPADPDAMRLTMPDVRIAGIRDMTPERIASAAARTLAIRLVGQIEFPANSPHSGSVSLSVAPHELPADSPLVVPECLNAVQFSLATSGETTLIGRGAGGPETATAILRDIVDIRAATRP